MGQRQNPPVQNTGASLVTPYYQRFHKQESDNFNLIMIGKTPELQNQFTDTTLPKIESVSGDRIFIKPIRRVINTLDDRFHMWLSVKPNGIDFSNNCTYPVVELTGDHWLLKLEATAVSLREKEFFPEVIWFEKVSQLRVKQSEKEPEKLMVMPYINDPPCPALDRSGIDQLMENLLKLEGFRYSRRMD